MNNEDKIVKFVVDYKSGFLVLFGIAYLYS